MKLFSFFRGSKPEEKVVKLLQQLTKQAKALMATNDELAADLEAAATKLEESNVLLGIVKTQVDKVGMETASLVQKIKDLEAAIGNQGNVPPNVLAALQKVKDQLSAQTAATNALSGSVAAVDAQVDDAPPTT